MGNAVAVAGQKTFIKKKKNFAPYGFLLPTVITIALVILVPFIMAWVISFSDVDLVRTGDKFIFNRGANYVNLIKDERAGYSIIATLYYVVGVVVVETILGLAIALFLNRNFRGKSLIRTLILIPYFITPVVGAIIWRILYDPTSGILNYYLGLIGLGGEIDWLGSITLAMPSIILVDAWMRTPFIVLIIMARMDTIPVDLYEAAFVDGASEAQVIRFITIPLSLPAILIAMTLRTIDALKAFDIIYVLTQGGPGGVTETANMYAYIVGFKYFRIGYATTIALVFTIIVTTAASIIISRAFKRAGTA